MSDMTQPAPDLDALAERFADDWCNFGELYEMKQAVLEMIATAREMWAQAGVKSATDLDALAAETAAKWVSAEYIPCRDPNGPKLASGFPGAHAGLTEDIRQSLATAREPLEQRVRELEKQFSDQSIELGRAEGERDGLQQQLETERASAAVEMARLANELGVLNQKATDWFDTLVAIVEKLEVPIEKNAIEHPREKLSDAILRHIKERTNVLEAEGEMFTRTIERQEKWLQEAESKLATVTAERDEARHSVLTEIRKIVAEFLVNALADTKAAVDERERTLQKLISERADHAVTQSKLQAAEQQVRELQERLESAEGPWNDQLDSVLGIIPTDMRQHSLGVVDCVQRLHDAWWAAVQENHLFRHGHKQPDAGECTTKLTTAEQQLVAARETIDVQCGQLMEFGDQMQELGLELAAARAECERLCSGEQQVREALVTMYANCIAGMVDAAVITNQEMDYRHVVCAVRQLSEFAKKTRTELAAANQEIIDAFDAIFPYVPEAVTEKDGPQLTLAQKIERMGAELAAANERAEKAEQKLADISRGGDAYIRVLATDACEARSDAEVRATAAEKALAELQQQLTAANERAERAENLAHNAEADLEELRSAIESGGYKTVLDIDVLRVIPENQLKAI